MDQSHDRGWLNIQTTVYRFSLLVYIGYNIVFHITIQVPYDFIGFQWPSLLMPMLDLIIN